MKKIAILISDIHLTKLNSDSILSLIKQIKVYAKENQINNIIIAGDIFQSRVGQPLPTLLGFQKILYCLKDFQIFAVPGNHDKQDADSEQSYLDVYNEFSNFFLANKQVVVEIENLSVCFLPYFKTQMTERLKSLIDSVEGDKILISHFSANGAKNNDGSVVEDGVSPSLLKPFKNVFLGHYHNRQQIGNNIHYIGGLCPQNYGEDNKKGFIVLYDDGSFEYQSLNFKKYIKKVFVLGEVGLEEIQEAKEKYANSENFVRFVFKGSDDQLVQIDKKQFEKVGIDVKKEDIKITKSIEVVQEIVFEGFNKSSIIESFHQFCEDNKIKKNKMSTGLCYLKKL